MSVHRPGFYADRFLNFMGGTVFKKIHPLRGASSKRKRSSIHAMRSASQEVLSPQKEEKDERKAQSMECLDRPLISSSKHPDLVTLPKSLKQAVSFSSSALQTIKKDLEEHLENSASCTIVALDDTVPFPPTQGSPDSVHDVYL